MMLQIEKDHQTEDKLSELPNHSVNLVDHKLNQLPAKSMTKNSEWIAPAALTTLVFFIFFIAVVYLNAR